jgi:hypothetical protein
MASAIARKANGRKGYVCGRRKCWVALVMSGSSSADCVCLPWDANKGIDDAIAMNFLLD